MIELNNYGQLKAIHTYKISNRILNNMKYTNDENLIELECIDNEYFLINENKQILFPNVPLFRLLGLDATPSKLINYNNAENVSENYFKIELSSNNHIFELDFDKEKNVFLHQNIFCNVFGLDNKSVKRLLEFYKTTKNGIVGFNKLDNTYTYASKTETVIFNMYDISTINITSCSLLDIRVKYMIYNGEYHEIDYDNNGLVTKVKFNGKNLVYYDKKEDSIISIHPLLFDPFNYDYIDTPLKYWVLDEYKYLDRSKKNIEFSRKTFEITNLDRLISDHFY